MPYPRLLPRPNCLGIRTFPAADLRTRFEIRAATTITASSPRLPWIRKLGPKIGWYLWAIDLFNLGYYWEAHEDGNACSAPPADSTAVAF